MERQSVNVDIEANRHTVTLNNATDSGIFQALEAAKPERLELSVGATGEVIACKYEGYNAQRIVEYVRSSQERQNDRFLLQVGLALLAIVVTGVSFYQVGRSWVAIQPVVGQYR